MCFKIIINSTTDLENSFVEENQLDCINMKYQIDDIEYKNYLDYRDLSIKDFYQMMRDGKISKTFLINSNEYIDLITPYLKRNIKVLVISFSSGLSGSFNSLRIAKEELENKFGSGKIFIVDSLCASMGEGLFVNEIVKLRKKGLSIEEVYKIAEIIKMNVNMWFTVDDLVYLKRGGRVSSTKAFFAGMLNIKPVLNVSNEGKLEPVFKVKGRKRSILGLYNQFVKAYDEKYEDVFISHGDCIEDAEFLKEKIFQNYPKVRIRINYIGPVIGAHSGPGTLALFFFGVNGR